MQLLTPLVLLLAHRPECVFGGRPLHCLCLMKLPVLLRPPRCPLPLSWSGM